MTVFSSMPPGPSEGRGDGGYNRGVADALSAAIDALRELRTALAGDDPVPTDHGALALRALAPSLVSNASDPSGLADDDSYEEKRSSTWIAAYALALATDGRPTALAVDDLLQLSGRSHSLVDLAISRLCTEQVESHLRAHALEILGSVRNRLLSERAETERPEARIADPLHP